MFIFVHIAKRAKAWFWLLSPCFFRIPTDDVYDKATEVEVGELQRRILTSELF